jgi:hypothetical protein
MKKILLIFSLLVICFSSVFSSPLRKQIQLLLQDSASGAASVSYIYFAQGTSPNFVPSEDVAITINPGDTVPQLYSFTLDNVSCSSNSYGVFQNTTIIKLGAGIYSPGTYVFSAMQFNNFAPATMLFLEDRLLGVTTDLRQTNYFVHLPQPGQVLGRFFLHVTYPPVAVGTAAGCWNNDGVISVTEDQSVTWSACKVFDSISALVRIDTNITGNFSFTGLPGGTYRLEFDYSTYALLQDVQIEQHQLISSMNVSNNHDTVLQNIQFFASGSNANQFQWSFGDGSNITGVANPVYFYINPGVYTVTVNCQNAYGCSGSADTVVYIEAATQIDEINGNTVKVITDSKSVRIEIDNVPPTGYIYTIYNVEGQLIKTGVINSPDLLLSFNNEPAGIYLVSIRNESSSLSKKVLITH